jgi:hypothetical protein
LPSSITLNGGGDSGDTLIVKDSVSNNRTAVYRAVTTGTANAGSVVVGSSTYAFTGLDPVDLEGFATVNLNSTTFPAANQVITVANGTNDSASASINISGTSGGTSFGTLRVRNATNLSINTSSPSGNDTITIDGADGTTALVTNLDREHGHGNQMPSRSPPAVRVSTSAAACPLPPAVRFRSVPPPTASDRLAR